MRFILALDFFFVIVYVYRYFRMNVKNEWPQIKATAVLYMCTVITTLLLRRIEYSFVAIPKKLIQSFIEWSKN